MINLRRINLNLLVFFEALYQEENLTAAAERINVSQPAMSNALSRLRAVFNDQLFVRSGYHMVPTPRAQRLAPSVLEALARVREGLVDNAEFDPTIPRTFVIGGVDHVDLVAIPELVRRNSGLLSTVHFHSVTINEGGYEEGLRTNHVDLILDVAPPVSPELHIEPIMRRRLVATAREGHPLEGKKLVSEDLLELQYAMLTPRETTSMAAVETYLKENNCAENIAVRVCNIRSLFDVIRNTDLVGFFPEESTSGDPNGLIPLDIDYPPMAVTHFMVWHQFQTDDPGHRWLREQVASIYRNVNGMPDTILTTV